MLKALFLLLLLSTYAPALAQDLNKSVLDAIIAGSKSSNTDALIILQDGKTVHKSYFDKPVKQIEAMSATKSIVSLAVGLLIEHDFLKRVDEPVSTFYPEWKQGKKQKITVRHLLEHTSGLQNVPNAGIEVEAAPDVIKLALAAEVDADPGTVYSYNNKATNLIAGIVEKASGLKMDTFLKKHLFEKIGVTQIGWRTDKAGNPLGMAGLQIFPEDLARVGQLILNKGLWEGQRIIGEEWLAKSFTPTLLTPEVGLLWWLMHENQWMVIDDAFLTKVRPNTDDATFALLGKLKGRYEGFDKIQAKGMAVYTPEELPAVARALSSVSPSQMRIENEGGVAGYAAVGYLGQYLIVLPKRNIVVVRMISAESAKNAPASDFSLLRRLARQL